MTGIISLAVCLLCLSAPVIESTLNSQYLSKFANDLYTYPLPPETEIVSQSAYVGSVRRCFFSAHQVFRTQLSQAEIEAYHDDIIPSGTLDFPASRSESRGSGVLWIVLKFMEQEEDGLLYEISMSDDGYDADVSLDPRCGRIQ